MRGQNKGLSVLKTKCLLDCQQLSETPSTHTFMTTFCNLLQQQSNKPFDVVIGLAYGGEKVGWNMCSTESNTINVTFFLLLTVSRVVQTWKGDITHI